MGETKDGSVVNYLLIRDRLPHIRILIIINDKTGICNID